MAEDEISVGYRFEATLEQSKYAYSRRMRRKLSMSWILMVEVVDKW